MRIRIPWLIDIETASTAKDVTSLVDHPSLDRDLELVGPLFNRKLLTRLLSTFHAGGKQLPGFRGRDDEERRVEQEKLRKALDAQSKSGNFDKTALKPAIEYVAGRGGLDNAMEAICRVLARLFNADYAGGSGANLWENAQTVQTSVRPFSLRGFGIRLTGRNVSARDAILKAVGDKPNGLHAIAITTANIKETLLKMRELEVVGTHNRAVNADTQEGFWLLVRTAPENMLRRVRATVSLPTSGSILTRDSLIILRSRKAQKSEPTIGFAFAEGGWSACPASTYVPALCWFIWQKAHDSNKDEGAA